MTRCELTADGSLRIPVEAAREHFPADVAVALLDGPDLLLMPLHAASNGGLVLKQRNARGDRSVLVSEALHFQITAGDYDSQWDAAQGALRIRLSSRTS